MFEDVWDAGGVWRVGLEADREDIVLVFSGYVKIVGARLVVLEEQCGELELRHVLGSLKGEAMEFCARLREASEVSHGCIAAAGEGARVGRDQARSARRS